MLCNHGALAIGKDLKDAYFKMEKFEHTAKIIFITRLLGGEKELHIEKVQELLKIAKEAYSVDQDLRNIF